MQPSEHAKDFLKTVCAQVRWKQAHETIRRDLADHIEDQTEAFIRAGMDEREASARAVKEMGDPVDVGLLLDSSYRPKIEWNMLAILGTLVMAGLLIRLIFYRLSSAEWTEYIVASLIGIGCFLLMLQVNFYRMLKWTWFLQIGFMILTLTIPLRSMFIPTYSDFHGFEYIWLQSLWILYPVIYALVIYRMRSSGFVGLISTGLLLILPVFLGIKSDAMTLYGVIACMACFILIMTAIFLRCYRCNRFLAAALVGGVSALGGYVLLIYAPYRAARVLAPLHPMQDPLGVGWLTLRIRELLANSVWLGHGAALSDTTQLFLEQHKTFASDFVLTTLIYQYGFIILAVLTLFFLALFAFGFYRTKRISNQLGKLLAIGILTALIAQTLLYIVPCFGYPAISSSALPFITGSSIYLVFDYLLLGLLLSLFRTDTLFADTSPRRKRLRLRFSWDIGLEDK